MSGYIYWTSFCGDETPYDLFWNAQLSVNTSNPDFTLCFQRTVVTWPPIVIFFLYFPIKCYLLHQKSPQCALFSFSKLNLLKTIAALIQIITLFIMIFSIGRNLPSGYYVTPADYVASIVRFITMGFVLFVIRAEHMKGEITSGLLSFLWLLTLICDIVQVRSNSLRQNTLDAPTQTYFVTFIISFICDIIQFLAILFPDIKRPKSSVELEEKVPLLAEELLHNRKLDGDNNLVNDNAKPSRIESASFLAKLTFQWLTPEMIRTYRKSAVFEDLREIRKGDEVKFLLKKFFRLYHKEPGAKGPLRESINREHIPLWRALLQCIGWDFFVAIVLRVVAIPVQFTNPQLLGLLIAFIESGDIYVWKGIGLAGLMIVASFATAVLVHNSTFHAFITGMKARSIVNGIVYRKSLKLSSTARTRTTMGQIVNLMSVDAQRIQDMFGLSTLLWSVPTRIIVCIYFLWLEVGPSCLAGLGVMLIIVPLNTIYFANKTFNLQEIQMEEKDQRFRVLNEILVGMKVLKLYAWEYTFDTKITATRKKELKTILWINLINAVGAASWLLSTYLISLAIFTAYLLVDPNNVLTASTTFVTISLINILSWPFSVLQLCVANTTQGLVSLRRISAFLELDELDSEGPNIDNTLTDTRIEVKRGSYSWGRDEPCILKDINLTVPTGNLVAIVGAVGSGKSSLISSLLGDTFQQAGKTKLRGPLAYVPQQAWILHDSLRDNITLGKPFIVGKYEKVLKACALEEDLAILPDGDYTEIGEKGINLSGGQKQRVSLARALYQDADLYLLDDPLSAVDAHVGKHIFDHVIGPKGVLRKKTRLFVTHGIPYLPHCDMIYVLKDGQINDVGTYDELLTRGRAFGDLIRNYLENEASEDSDHEVFKDELASYISGTDTEGYATSTNSISEKRRVRRRRRQSNPSHTNSTKEESLQVVSKLITEEKEGEGNVSSNVITSYMSACGYSVGALVIITHIIYIVFQILTNLWLSDWADDRPTNGTYDREQSLYRLTIYGVLGIGQTLSAAIEAIAVGIGCYTASKTLHNSLLKRILRAPMSFFDTTPLGRIMNRFSRDVDIIDANLPLYIRQFLFAVSPIIITVILITITTPIFVAVLVPLAIVYIIIYRTYVKSVRQWKRIDSVRRSPIYVHFDESITGASSVRAYGRQRDFIDKCDQLIDESQRPWFLIIAAYRWIGVTMESVGSSIVFFASLFAVLERNNITPGAAGLSVSYALQMTVYLNTFIRVGCELETYIVSVERVDEYLSIDSEADLRIVEKRPPSNWPEHGAIQLSNYSTRYRAGLDLVLKEISCFIKPEEKIGIVGRTGAGKSSLSMALFRIIEAAEGAIYIDGRQVDMMGLHDLRERISIIPQDPVVFSGTLRSNLDPFEKYSDADIWEALENAHLRSFVQDSKEGLCYECGDNGEALSIGQRQLLCLARALLRRNKILVLDEATAAVDFETDALIQITIQNKFSNCTILTVAHRLHTVMHYDRIMVLGNGEILEFDTPSKLLSNKTTSFYKMAKDAGLV